jgi:tetratricopeptide (TPR) repeat protein
VERVFLSNCLTSRRPCQRPSGRPHWLRLGAVACAALTLANLTPMARAQQVPLVEHEAISSDAEAPPPAALDHYERGRALYLAGRYREAVGELESALKLDPNSPNLVYNLAHVYELLGEMDLAIRHYRHYRDLLGDSDKAERARVDGTLQRLEGARQHVVEPPPPPPRVMVQRVEHGVADGYFWSVTALALGSFAAGGVLGKMAVDAEHDAQRRELIEPEDFADRRSKIARSNNLALACDISLLAGAVLGTTAILLFALRTKPVKPTTTATIGVDANAKGAFLMFRGQL